MMSLGLMISVLIIYLSLISMFSNFGLQALQGSESIYPLNSTGAGVFPFINYGNVTTTVPKNYSSIIKVGSDRSGIPIVDYGYNSGVHIGLQRNPLTTAHFAIDYYDRYRKNGDILYKQLSLNNSKWLLEHAVNRDNYSLLEYHFPWPYYNLTSPWRSALAQADAMVAMIKADQLTGNKNYLDKAKMFLNSFFVPAKDGGFTYKTPHDGWWYEEFVGKGGKEPRVLNGMMATLIGIYSYYKYTNDSSAKYLFDEGIVALKKNLAHYNIPAYNYSLYDSLGTTSPLFYHKAHIDLLSRLYNITNDQTFRQYHDIWSRFKPPPYIHQKLSELPPTKIYS